MLHTRDMKIAKLQQEVLLLRAENARLRREVNDLEDSRLTIDKIRLNKVDCACYTGLPEFGIFETMFQHFAPRASQMEYWKCRRRSSGETKGRLRDFDLRDEFFMVLVRLRTGMPGKEISRNFGISEGHFSKVLAT
ncbi:unnamed protein product [Ixodes hexagonus]